VSKNVDLAQSEWPQNVDSRTGLGKLLEKLGAYYVRFGHAGRLAARGLDVDGAAGLALRRTLRALVAFHHVSGADYGWLAELHAGDAAATARAGRRGAAGGGVDARRSSSPPPPAAHAGREPPPGLRGRGARRQGRGALARPRALGRLTSPVFLRKLQNFVTGRTIYAMAIAL